MGIKEMIGWIRTHNILLMTERGQSVNFKYGLLILLFFLVLVCPACAEEETWAWVRASSVSNDWRVLKGVGKLHIDGTKFTAELYDQEHKNFLRFKIEGTIEGDKINAKVTTQNSDYGMGAVYTGYFREKKFTGFADIMGRETITLTDGWNFLGLTKAIMKKK